MQKPTLYLLRGLPGSGKSTLGRLLYEDCFGVAWLEADDYFVDSQSNYNFDASKLYLAHEDCQHKCQDLLSNGISVVVANTSTTEKEVRTYQQIAALYGANFVSLIVENRHGGVNTHNVPEETLVKMKNRFSIKL